MAKEKIEEQEAVMPAENKKAPDTLKFPYEVCLEMHPRFRDSLAVILDKKKSYTRSEVDRLLTAFKKREVK